MLEEKGAPRHHRFNLQLPLWVRFRAPTEEHDRTEEPAAESGYGEEQTTTTAISAESCFFYVAKKPALGAKATMRVDIPMPVSGRVGQVLCQGSVVWVSNREMQGRTGVACTIDSYRFEPPRKAQPGPEQAL